MKKKTRYERFMLACIDSLPFKFNSPGQPNPYKPTGKERVERIKDKRIKGEAKNIRIGKVKETVYTGEQYAPYIKQREKAPGKDSFN